MYKNTHSSFSYIHSSEKLETAQLFLDRRMGKLWYIHRMEYHSAAKKSKVVPHATTCMNLKNIMCVKKNLPGWAHFIWFQQDKILELKMILYGGKIRTVVSTGSLRAEIDKYWALANHMCIEIFRRDWTDVCNIIWNA